MLSQLTRLPRIAKVAILLAIDGVLGALSVWTAVCLRLGGSPKGTLQQALIVAVMAFFLVPIAGLVLGNYRSVIRFATPKLSNRAAILGLTCGAIFSIAAGFGGAPWPKAVAFGAVFALVLFAFQVLSRQAAR